MGSGLVEQVVSGEAPPPVPLTVGYWFARTPALRPRPKLRVYAAAGVPTYVIVNIPEDRIEVYAEPVRAERRYGRRTDHRAAETLVLPIAEGRTLTVKVADILGASRR